MCASLHIAKDTCFFIKKKELEGHVDKTFITEHLTRQRYDLLKKLNTLRVGKKIHSFWTHDGSVLAKETERSRPLVVKSRQDIYRLGWEILSGDKVDQRHTFYIFCLVVNEMFCINVQIVVSFEWYLLCYVNINTCFCFCYFCPE